MVFATTATLIPWYGMCAMLASDGRSRDEARDRVVIVGTWADAATLAVELEHAERPATVIDVLSLDEALAGKPKREALIESVQAGDATVVVLDRDAQMSQTIIDQVAKLHESGVRIRTLSLFYEEWLGKLPVSELERVSLMFDIGELHRVRYSRIKRMLDVGIASVGALVLLVVTPLVCTGNLLANRGTLFFRQTRVGRNGTTFTIYKFRSMRRERGLRRNVDRRRRSPYHPIRPAVAAQPHRRTATGAERVERRPCDRRSSARTTALRRAAREQVAVLPLASPGAPGLTGWAQVKYGYAGNESDALEKLQYEFYYLRRQSLSFDLRVMVRTLRSVLRGGGR